MEPYRKENPAERINPMCHITDNKDHFRESPAQKSYDGNGGSSAHAPAPADGTRATRELSESPAMRAKLLDGMATPLKDCLPEDEVIW